MRKKRFIRALAFLALITIAFSGVSKTNHSSAVKAEEQTLSLIATVFPAYDFARQLVGDTGQVRLLLPPGSESHSYEPTPQDIIDIQKADLFLCVGGESESWVDGILASMGSEAPEVFRMMDCVTAVAEEHSASMERDHDAAAEVEMDEHVWTSPKNAMLIVQKLEERLSLIAPQNAAAYQQNAASYLGELRELDEAFSEATQNAARNVLVFADRFPLRYFADAYGLRYDAAFPGCSEDSEPSVKTVMSLVDEVLNEKIPIVFYIEFSSRKTADIIAEETGAGVRLFHSCHNVSAAELEAGATYVSLMRNNVEVLKEALN